MYVHQLTVHSGVFIKEVHFQDTGLNIVQIIWLLNLCTSKVRKIYLIYHCFLFAENPDSVVRSYFSKFEEQWFSYCNEELEKINTFFAGKTDFVV